MRTLCALALALTLVGFLPSRPRASSTSQAHTREQRVEQINRTAAAWCAESHTELDSIFAWAHAHRRTGSDVPTPPEAYPPCVSCDQAGPNPPANPDVDQWILDSMNPEAANLAKLNQIIKHAELTIPSPELTDANVSCVGKLLDDPYLDATNDLVSSLVEKTKKMAQQFRNEPKRAYAGTLLLLKVAHFQQTATCENRTRVWTRNNTLTYYTCNGASKGETDLPQIAAAWTRSLVNTIEDEAVRGHQYSLCPTYASLARSIELLGGEGVTFDELAKVQAEIVKALHFQLDVKFTASGSDKNGSFNVALSGSGAVHFELDPGKSCFKPVVDGGMVHMNVDNYSVTDADFVGPKSFDLAVDRLIVTMCDTASPPLFILHFKDYPPFEQVVSKGHQTTTALIQSTFGLGLNQPALANVGKSATNATLDTSGTKGVPTNGAPNTVDLKRLQAELQAHQKDPGWFTSPEGQAVIKEMQAGALAKVYGQAVNTEFANTPGVVANPANSVRVNWTNGSDTPVDASLNSKFTTKDGGGSGVLKITLTQQSK